MCTHYTIVSRNHTCMVQEKVSLGDIDIDKLNLSVQLQGQEKGRRNIGVNNHIHLAKVLHREGDKAMGGQVTM